MPWTVPLLAAERPDWTVGTLLLTNLLYLVCCYLTGKNNNVRPLFVLAPALFLRLLALPSTPSLSEDVFRYRWEGLVQAHGLNPYLHTPGEPALEHLRDETYPLIPAPGFKAGYGPLLELVQRGNYHLAAALTQDPLMQAFLFKLPAALFDLGVLAVLARAYPMSAVAWYAWSPTVIVEFWVNGHNDALVVFLITLALLAAARDRWTWAFVALSMAASAKLWPILLFPVFIGFHRRPLRWRQWTVCLPVFLLCALPYYTPRWPEIWENARFMSGFLGGWRNNDSLFGLLLWITGDIYPAKYAAFTIAGGGALLFTLLRWPIERASLGAISLMLLVSANVHPWYLTWLFPMLALWPWPPLLLWSALMPIGYQVLPGWRLLGEWNGSTNWRWLIYTPVFAWIALDVLARFRRRGVS
jgi:alpha-1,6-mannosyltransferase